MNREEFFRYVSEQYGVEADYPWEDENAVFRHPANRKWFALLMRVGRDKLGLPGAGSIDIVNLKGEPMLLATLRSSPGFFPAYHMNKETWISAALDGSADEGELKAVLDMSYQLTSPLRKKKKSKS